MGWDCQRGRNASSKPDDETPEGRKTTANIGYSSTWATAPQAGRCGRMPGGLGRVRPGRKQSESFAT